MICDNPNCTGVHNKAKPASTWCPAAKDKHKIVARPTKEYARAWAKKNKKRIKGYGKSNYAKYHAQIRASALRRRFGISPDQYDVLLESQGGVCAICNRACESGRRLSVDHCHSTGLVRGLLCSKCNRGLGHFNDSATLLSIAILYLEAKKAKQ